MDDAEEFGTWLARQLRREGISQAELAERLDVTRAAVSAWVTGRAEPRPEKLRAIAEAFAVDPATVYNRDEKPVPVTALTWYHRPAYADGGREFGNAAAFAFDPSLGTLIREATQNSLDERVDPDHPVRVRFTIHEISGERYFRFLDAMRWDELSEHYEQAARHGQKVGRTLAEALADMREHSRLTLIRVDDYNASGLTGDDFDDKGGDNRFAAVVRRQLDSHKTGSAGGSFGLGKVALWGTSGLGLVLINSTLSTPFEGKRDRRLIGRLDLPWRRLADRTAYAGPAWFGEADPARTGATLSWWADEDTVKGLHLERESTDPGTSFLIVGVADSILKTGPDEMPGADPESTESRRRVLRAMHDEIGAELSANFWAAMVSGRSRPALLDASVTTLHNGAVVVPEERVRPQTSQPARTRALQAFYDGTTTAELTSAEDVVMTTVRLAVPVRKDGVDGRRRAADHDAVLLVTPATDADGKAVDRLVCMRGTRMDVESRSIADMSSPGRFTAVLLAGLATGRSTADSSAAEEFLRAAEPPEHNAWKKTEDLTATYARGAAARLEEFRREMIPAVHAVTRRQDTTPESDGPALLRELLSLNSPAPSRSPGFPTVKRLDGHVDHTGAWNVEVEVRVPQRADPWTFAPVLKFVTASGPHLSAAWQTLEAASGCELIAAGTLRTGGAPTALFRGTSIVQSHPVSAELSRVTIDLVSVKEAGS
jgi:transcriptional regulator with XRE-family HTH domain